MTMTIDLSNYPIFAPNQVLTDQDLNGIVQYLEGLNQFSRVFFVGMGVAYGLNVQYFGAPLRIEITPGCGITSEGYVVQTSAQTDPKLVFTHYRQTTILKNKLVPGDSSSQNWQVKELMSQPTSTGKTDIQPLSDAVLAQQMVIVLYDWQDEPQRETCTLDYDQQAGANRRFRLRFFLLPLSDESGLSADLLLREGFQVNQLPDRWKLFKQQYGIAAMFTARDQFVADPTLMPQVPRFGDANGRIDLSAIAHYEAWRQNYRQICETAIAAIGGAFPQVFRMFSPFFSSFSPNSPQDFRTLEDRLRLRLQQFDPDRIQGVAPSNIEPPYALQYFYDYLSQLVVAYTELVEMAFDLMDDATPQTRRFPRYLMLGQIPPQDQPPKNFEAASAYRHQFIQPRIYNNSEQRFQQVCHLYERLLQLTQPDSFVPLPFYRVPIKITPSRDRSALLGDQAIPVYLNYSKLVRYWNYDAYRKGRSDRLPAYATSTPLTYRLDAYQFYRIEGHVGRGNAEALKRIQDDQQRYSLPFDVISLKLGSLSSFQDLNLSAEFEPLNDTFQRLKDEFNRQRTANESWDNNALLTTLNKIFFSQPSLAAANPDLLVSRLLEQSKQPENYEFTTTQVNHRTVYNLSLKQADGSAIAVVFRDRSKTIKPLDFEARIVAGIPEAEREAEIKKAQQQVVTALLTAFQRQKLTYQLEPDTPAYLSFHLDYVSADVLSLPLGGADAEAATVALRSRLSIQGQPAEIQESSCPDVLTIYGLLRDSPVSIGPGIGNPQAAQAIGEAELTGLLNAYQQQLEQLISLHLFHRFAQQHPGLEPLGGVPKGGTFILVYADGADVGTLLNDEKSRQIFEFRAQRAQALRLPPPDPVADSMEQLQREISDRKDVVVADFCLPYRIGTRSPAVTYVLASPRPILLLSKVAFCQDDSTLYYFTLKPEGGIVKGEGVGSNQQGQYFQPTLLGEASQAQLQQGNPVSLTFSYAIDNTYDTLSVVVYPEPTAELTVGEAFCHNAAATEIGLAEGTPDTIELTQVTINGTTATSLNPALFATQGQPERVTIAGVIRDRTTQCTNTVSRTVTIHPLPTATLSVQPNQSFCQNAEPVEITLTNAADVELVQVTINGTATATLDPAKYPVGEVAIAAQIRSALTQCETTLRMTVRIKPLPDASFRLGTSDRTTFSTSDDPVVLRPQQPGGRFQAQMDGRDISETVLNGAEFFPAQVRFSTPATQKTVTLRYTIAQNGCGNTSKREVTVVASPAIAVLHLVSRNTAGEITQRLPIQEGQTFSRDEFFRKRFEAAVSGKVGSVVFTYTSPNEEPERVPPNNAAPYLMGGGWEPTVGKHTIAMQPFSEANAAGIAGAVRSVRFTIVDDPPEQPSAIADLPPSDRPAGLPRSDVPSPPSLLAALVPPATPTGFAPFAVPMTPPPHPAQRMPRLQVATAPPKPRQVWPNLLQVATMSAIAVLLSLIWVQAARPPQQSQPANATEQPAP